MANRENLEQGLQYAIGCYALEKCKADGLVTATEDGIIKLEADIKELEAHLREYAQEITEELGEAIDVILDPDAYTILAESLTAPELRESGVAENMVQLFDQADTAGRITVLDLLEPSVILPLIVKKYTVIKDRIRKRDADNSIPIVDRITAGLLRQIRTATPESLQGSRGLLRADMNILEQSIKREARDTIGGDQLTFVFRCEGEYPDGTKWERDATPEEEAEYRSWAQ